MAFGAVRPIPCPGCKVLVVSRWVFCLQTLPVRWLLASAFLWYNHIVKSHVQLMEFCRRFGEHAVRF